MRFVQAVNSRPVDATQPTRGQTTSAVALFLTVTLLLGILLVGTVLVIVAQRLRRRRAKREGSTITVDPWAEAGKRIDPYEPQNPDV